MPFQLTWYLTPHSHTGALASGLHGPPLMALSPVRLDASAWFRAVRLTSRTSHARLEPLLGFKLTWILLTSSALD